MKSINPKEMSNENTILNNINKHNNMLSITFWRSAGDIMVSMPFTCSMKIDFDEKISPQDNYENVKRILESCAVEIFANIQDNIRKQKNAIL
jgi:hypothetical protein